MSSPIGRRVRDLRTSRKLSQAAPGKLAGLDQSTVSDVERGVTLSPGLRISSQLAAALGVSVEYLVSGDPERRAAPMLRPDIQAMAFRIQALPVDAVAAITKLLDVLDPPPSSRKSDRRTKSA